MDPYDRNMHYQWAVVVNIDDPLVDSIDLINKGFAYIAFDKNLFTYSARECFLKATKLDINKKYSSIIKCGLKQVENEDEEPCYHAVKPI